MLKVIEVLAGSDKSWEDASLNAIREARETVCGVKFVCTNNLEAQVENNQITAYRINDKISFEPE